jgi:predicted dehydrogenase
MLGQKITQVSAQMDHCVASRQLEDDAHIAARFDGKAIGRFWLSAVATGQQHGFNMRVFGSKGGLRWWQEQPNQLWYAPGNGPAQTLERGSAALYPEALDASRITQGHAEGMLIAFANIYRGLHRKISGGAGLFPTVQDGAAMVRAVHAAVASGAAQAKWVDV